VICELRLAAHLHAARLRTFAGSAGAGADQNEGGVLHRHHGIDRRFRSR
jgi:hypothetical protein